MNTNPKLIIIMGLPATGKTTLSKQLAETYNLPLFGRDEMKVRIMDKLGRGDREWSKRVGEASYLLLSYVIEQMTRSHESFIVESDFKPEFANYDFSAVHKKGYDIIQIICSASKDVIVSRWKERANQDVTHPSSTEGERGFNDLIEYISRGQRQPLDVPSEIIHVDTSENVSDASVSVINRLKDLL